MFVYYGNQWNWCFFAIAWLHRHLAVLRNTKIPPPPSKHAYVCVWNAKETNISLVLNRATMGMRGVRCIILPTGSSLNTCLPCKISVRYLGLLPCFERWSLYPTGNTSLLQSPSWLRCVRKCGEMGNLGTAQSYSFLIRLIIVIVIWDVMLLSNAILKRLLTEYGLIIDFRMVIIIMPLVKAGPLYSQ